MIREKVVGGQNTESNLKVQKMSILGLQRVIHGTRMKHKAEKGRCKVVRRD